MKNLEGEKPKRRAARRKDHIAKDLRTPKYKPRVVPAKTVELEEERRFRRYKGLDNLEPYHPLDQDDLDDDDMG